MKAKVTKVVLLLLIFLVGGGTGFLVSHKIKPAGVETKKTDKYAAFVAEVYETIQNNYWDKLTDEQLADLFTLATEKLTAQPQTLKKKNKEGVLDLVSSITKQIEDETKKKEFVVQLADITLANLKPFGRSRLYTKKEEKALSKNVKNITETDYYQVLGVDKNASAEQIAQAFEKKAAEWNPQTNKSPEAKQKYEEIQRAFETLKDPDNRKIYDTAGVEPTISYRLIRPEIFYLHIKKFSPTTFDELRRVTAKVDKDPGPDTLILDLRDNVGGAIDALPYFLGPFIGQDQYAYQFFHQGERTDFKTKTGWMPSLIRYKKVVVLINENTQSSAEVMAAVLKKYNVGVLVGTKTKGWGTVEKVFPLEHIIDPQEKHSIFLVHSLTLRDDNQPIEGKGVEPVVDINNAGWEKQLYAYFHYDDLIEAVKEVLKTS